MRACSVGSIGGPAVRREALTPDLYVGIFLKHIAAGAGYICLPSTAHVPDALLSDLETSAKQLAPQRPSARSLVFLKAREKASIHALPPGGTTSRGAAGVYTRTTSALIQKLKEQKPKDIPLIANVSGLGFFAETFMAGSLNSSFVKRKEKN